MSFQENLRHYREDAGFSSARSFAEHIDVPYTTYLNYENKNAEPKYEVLCKIAAALGVTTDQLLGYSLNDYDESVMILENAGLQVDDNRKDGLIAIDDVDHIDSNGYPMWSAICFLDSRQDLIRLVKKAIDEHRAITKQIFDKTIRSILDKEESAKFKERYRKTTGKLFPELSNPNNSHN